jgi:glyoxylase-like metal-dependent hydrolase (beta-lactamase superfamily II)
MLDRLGRWKIHVLETGDFRLDGGAMMGSVPRVLWSKTNPPDKLNRIDLSLRCLLLVDGDRKVLVETGMGNKFDEKFGDMFCIKQSDNPLTDSLEKIGYTTDDITDVVLTHLHFDHSGGATAKNFKGEVVPMFEKATYHVSLSNWSAGMSPSPRDKASYLKINFEPLDKHGVLQLVSDNAEILDGISTYSVNGHTTGQQLVKVSDQGETLVFCSDLIPLRSHLKLPWIMGYDLNAALSLTEKTKFLEQACANDWWLFFYHDPKTVAVKIEKDEKYYKVKQEVMR